MSYLQLGSKSGLKQIMWVTVRTPQGNVPVNFDTTRPCMMRGKPEPNAIMSITDSLARAALYEKNSKCHK